MSINLIRESIKDIQKSELEEILRVCDEWLSAYDLELYFVDDCFVLTNQNETQKIFSEDINGVLDYISELIKVAMEKADYDDYVNMAKDYEIITGNNLLFSLCLTENCTECDGIDVTCLNNNLYRCKHTNNILYKCSEDTLIHIDLLNNPKWIERAKR